VNDVLDRYWWKANCLDADGSYSQSAIAKGGRTLIPAAGTSSINRLFAASNGLTNLTPASSKPSWRSSVGRWRTPARLYRVPITLHRERRSVPHRTLRTDQPAIRPTQVCTAAGIESADTDCWNNQLKSGKLRSAFQGVVSFRRKRRRPAVSGSRHQVVKVFAGAKPIFPWSKNDALSSASRSLATALWRAASTNEIRTVSGGRYLSRCPTRKAECENVPPCSRYGNIAIRHECG